MQMKKASLPIAQRSRQSMAGAARDQKRNQILQVAEKLFFQQGYAGTSIADIVDKLGVTKPYLYYYFHSKDEIFETLCWQASYACLTSMHFDAEDGRPAAEKLHEGLHRLASANVTYFKSSALFYRETSALQPAVRKKLRSLARRFYDELCALLEAGRDEGALLFENTKLTALAVGSVIGFMYTWYKPGGQIGAAEMADQITSILLKIVGEKQPKKRALQNSLARK